MIRNVLVALDGSPASEAVLPYLETFLRCVDADVVLAFAVPKMKPRQEKLAEVYLDGIAARLRKKGAQVKTEVLRGTPAAQIVRRAAEGVDLVLMCTRGQKGLKRLAMGSVAQEVLRQSAVPVLIVRPPAARGAPTKFRRILVPLDGTHRSAAGLPEVTTLAKAFGATVVLFLSMPPATSTLPLPGGVISDNLVRIRKELQEREIDADIVIWSGDPAKSILEFASTDGADLVALTTHGRSGLDRFLAGSVAETLLVQGRVPLLVKRVSANTPHAKAPAVESGRRALSAMKELSQPSKGPYNH